jgi:hypothetical protein
MAILVYSYLLGCSDYVRLRSSAPQRYQLLLLTLHFACLEVSDGAGSCKHIYSSVIKIDQRFARRMHLPQAVPSHRSATVGNGHESSKEFRELNACQEDTT